MTTNLRFSSSGVREVTADMEKINQKSREQLEAIKDNQRASQEFDRVTRGINRRNEVEQDRYNRLLAEAKAAFDSNKISAQAYQREVEKINDEAEKGRGRFRQYNEQTEKTFGATAVSKLTQFAAGVISIHAAERLITEELQAQSELRDRAEQTKATIFTSQQDVRRNVGESVQDQEAVLRQNRQLADRLNISETFINQARASALSASGGNVQASLAAVTAAAGFLGDKPADIGAFAGSLLDLSKVTGTTDANVNLGLLTKVGALSRVTSPAQQAQNIPGALIGARAFGASAAGSAALFGAISEGSGDFTGAPSGTGLISLAKQLSEFSAGDPAKIQASIDATQGLLLGEADPIRQLGHRRALIGLRDSLSSAVATSTALAGITTPEGRIDFLQSRPDLAASFLADASFEKRVEGPIRQLLLDPTSSVAQDYRRKLGLIPDNAGLGKIGSEFISSLQSGGLSGANARSRALASFVEGQELLRPDVLGRDEIENLRRSLALTGGSSLGAKFDTFIGEQAGGGITAGDAAGFLEQRRSALLRPTQSVSAGIGGAATIAREITPEERQQAKTLEQLIRELVAINRKQLDKDTSVRFEVSAE